MIVLDTSAAIAVLGMSPPGRHLAERLGEEEFIAAPHVVDLEFLNALRKLLSRGWITLERARGALREFAEIRMVRYPHEPLMDRIWELRDNVSAYDAAYVALAEALEATLVTCDARLARSSGHRARIELFG